MKSEDKSNYRIVQIRIKKSNELFQFCDDACFASKNLYNVGNFHIRQVFSGLQKEPEFRHQNEIEVLEKIENQIELLNDIKLSTFDKQKVKHVLKGEPFGREEPTRLNPPDKEKPFLCYNMLDGILKLTCQADYVAMPAQVNQQTLKLLYRDWKSFFEGQKAYMQDPSVFTGMPKPPRYAKKDGRKLAIFTNQNGTIKVFEGRNVLSFPKTKLRLDMGGHPLPDGVFKEARIVPGSTFYAVELVFEIAETIAMRPLITDEATTS